MFSFDDSVFVVVAVDVIVVATSTIDFILALVRLPLEMLSHRLVSKNCLDTHCLSFSFSDIALTVCDELKKNFIFGAVTTLYTLLSIFRPLPLYPSTHLPLYPSTHLPLYRSTALPLYPYPYQRPDTWYVHGVMELGQSTMNQIKASTHLAIILSLVLSL